ncbi:NCS1 family nucleobase:cation symporter-1 [Exophiala viscosa]|uniref:NCS1 family nucleobase:cation symporter-1 n=1 Tax=Exophiala viscosa TaxID=2486360 RepID=UPI00219A9E31|nr:NCS1 family nucleobase:cation symporter-1 [Exophiala viscosa]
MRKTLPARIALPGHSPDNASVWINDDIRPLPPSRRLWDSWAFVSYWAVAQLSISNFSQAASLVAIGLSVWQAMIAVILGRIITAIVAVYNGAIGAEWHIGFPVLSRAVWGIYGSYVPIIQRIVLAFTWFSVQAWFGGLCVTSLLSALSSTFQNMNNTLPLSANLTTKELIGWVVYNIISIPILYVRPEKTRYMLFGMNIVSMVTLVSMTIYLLGAAHGGGPLLSAPAVVTGSSGLGWAVVQGTTIIVGGLAVGLTNQPDYSRFARHPGDQVFGQWFSIITFGTIMPLFGCLAASATMKLYGTAMWNAPVILQQILDSHYDSGSRAAIFFASIGLIVCQLAITTVDNAYSAGMDLAGLFPKYINIRRGCYIGLIAASAMCPWELLSTAATFTSVMSAYGLFFGPLIGIQVCDYFVIRHRRHKLSDLYTPSKTGIYYFWNGFNWRTFVAWVIGWAPQIPGFIAEVNPKVKVPIACVRMYYLAFPLGLTISFMLYWSFCKLSPPMGAGEIDDIDYFGTFTREEAAEHGMSPLEPVEGVESPIGNTTDEAKQASVKEV